MPEEGVTLGNLRDELYDRGYDYLNQDARGRARATRWANEAYAELCLEEPWPFRLTTTTGAAPLEIDDVDKILTVVDADNVPLHEVTERWLTTYDLTQTGTPLWFYRDSLTVRVWPVGTGSLTVRYYRLPPELVDAADETLVPARYMGTIVDAMVTRAAADRDNEKAAALADRMYQRGLALMRRQLLVAPTHVEHTFVSEDD